MEKKSKYIIKSVSILAALSSLYVFFGLFILKSDFAWTAKQPQTQYAFVEIALITAINAYVLTRKIHVKYRLLILMAGIIIFSFLHSFIWALLIGLVYIILTIHIGNIFSRLLRVEKRIHSSFSIGFAVILAVVAILSFFKIGTPYYLRRVLPFLMALAVFFDRKEIVKNYRKLPEIEEHVGSLLESKVGLWSSIFAISAIYVVIGKANFCTDYDSLWYGLRSEYVLAPSTGIFDNINLVACVYTYPKGFEIYALPFAGLNTYSFIIAVNVVIWLLCGLAIIDTVKEFGLSKGKEISSAMLLMLTPAVTNLVNTAKPDVLSLYFTLIGILYSVRALQKKREEYWIIASSSLLTTFSIKSTSIVFSTILLIVLIVFRIADRRVQIEKGGWGFWSSPVICCAITSLRNIKLTGLPMTSVIVNLLTNIGFKIKYPYVLNSSRRTSVNELLSSGLIWKRIARLPRLFFYPNSSNLITTERTWWGILFSVLFIIAIADFIINIKKRLSVISTNRVFGIINVMFILVSAASIGTMLLLDYPDGNYYMIMQAITYLYLGVYLVERFRNGYALVVTLILENFILAIVTSCAWSVGFTPVSLKNLGYYNHVRNYKETVANNKGIRNIYDYMKEHDDARYLFLSEREDEMFVLPGITELFHHQGEWAGYSLESADALYEFASCTGVKYFLADETISSFQIYQALPEMQSNGWITSELEADGFTLYKVNLD